MCRKIYFIGLAIILIILCSIFYLYNKTNINENNIYVSDKIVKNIKIPKKIHQVFFPKSEMTNLIKETIKKWKSLNPDYEYRLYDDNDMREFIKKEYSERELNAYDKLIPGSYKCNLFRYLVLYKHGGVYADTPMIPYSSLDEIIEGKEVVLVKDIKNNGIYNAFIAINKNNNFLKEVIEKTLTNIENSYYGKNIHDITGPYMLGTIFNNYSWENEILILQNCKYNHFFSGIIKKNNKVILIKPYMKFIKQKLFNRKKQKNRYTYLWKKRKVYNIF